MKFSKCIPVFLILACLISFAGCSPAEGWIQRDGGYVYLVGGECVTGWQTIDEARYWFDDAGFLATGWQTIEEDIYYFLEDGKMATLWQDVDGIPCFFREDGVRVIGWLTQDGDTYFLHETGVTTGPAEIQGDVYLFNEEGKLSTGWQLINGARYWADQTGHIASGWQEIDGIRYCFGKDYAQLTGWLERDGFRFYFRPNGTPAQGSVYVDNTFHTFAVNGQEILLVNPWNTLPEGYEVDLTNIDDEHQIAAFAYEDFLQMMADCKAAELDPAVCSSYRTHAYQQKLYARRIQRYMDEGYSEEKATELAGRSVAVPGTSEHQLGLALDIIDNSNWTLDESQADTPTQQWLMANSWRYGWILRYPEGSSASTGIIYEPWHYRYVGREAAEDIHASGLCLEDYLQSLTVSVG